MFLEVYTSSAMSSADRLVVFADVHARPELTRAIWNEYGDTVDGYISAGDEIDGPDAKPTLDILTYYMGARSVRSNHTQHLLTAMYEADEEMRHLYASTIWSQVHDRVLESYGIYPTIPTPGTALKLRDKLPKEHVGFLWDTPLYIEEDDFVVTHADINGDEWPLQKWYLNSIQLLNRAGNYIIDGLEGMPPHLGEGMSVPSETHLATSGLKKILINGHFHLGSPDVNHRITNDGQRIFLATPDDVDFGFVYESWNQRIRMIQAA